MTFGISREIPKYLFLMNGGIRFFHKRITEIRLIEPRQQKVRRRLKKISAQISSRTRSTATAEKNFKAVPHFLFFERMIFFTFEILSEMGSGGPVSLTDAIFSGCEFESENADDEIGCVILKNLKRKIYF